MKDMSDTQFLYACLVMAAALILIIGFTVQEYRRMDRRCACGKMRVNKGSHYACPKCDFDPDTRPSP